MKLYFLLIVFVEVVVSIQNWPFPDDGILEPEPYYERYRRKEYSEDPFFQWWYFCVKDTKNDIFWAISYDTFTDLNDKNEGYYQTFAVVDKSKTEIDKWVRYEKYSMDNFKVKNYFDVSVSYNNEILFSLEVINNDTYHIKGSMNHSDHAWKGSGIDNDIPIVWDLTVYRIYGWFGMAPPLEELDLHFGKGTIMWNTYSHDSEVEGFIKIGNKTTSFSRTSQYRVYGDMNWGNKFPSSQDNPPIDYPWGWYYFGKPNQDITKDISVVAGCGLTDVNFPAYGVFGAFVDVRLDSKFHIGARELTIFDESWISTRVIHTSNDVDLYYFNVTRSNWTTYTDNFGSALIPLQKTVTVITGHHTIIIDFFSDLDSYNRMLYPYRNYYFSDFEALGVNAHLIVKSNKEGTIVDMWSNDSGLEYGYKVEIND